MSSLSARVNQGLDQCTHNSPYHLSSMTLWSTTHGSHYILVLKFKDFQGPWSCIFKDQFSPAVYSMDSITAIF